jgi:hypothetical protein
MEMTIHSTITNRKTIILSISNSQVILDNIQIRMTTFLKMEPIKLEINNIINVDKLSIAIIVNLFKEVIITIVRLRKIMKNQKCHRIIIQ